MKAIVWEPTCFYGRLETRDGELDVTVSRDERGRWSWEVESNGCVLQRGGSHRDAAAACRRADAAARRLAK